jgi:hypothetical protein
MTPALPELLHSEALEILIQPGSLPPPPTITTTHAHIPRAPPPPSLHPPPLPNTPPTHTHTWMGVGSTNRWLIMTPLMSGWNGFSACASNSCAPSACAAARARSAAWLLASAGSSRWTPVERRTAASPGEPRPPSPPSSVPGLFARFLLSFLPPFFLSCFCFPGESPCPSASPGSARKAGGLGKQLVSVESLPAMKSTLPSCVLSPRHSTFHPSPCPC